MDFTARQIVQEGFFSQLILSNEEDIALEINPQFCCLQSNQLLVSFTNISWGIAIDVLICIQASNVIPARISTVPTLQKAENLVAPRDLAVAHKIAEIFQKVTGTAASVDTNFFQVGGSSLLAIELNNKIQAAFGVRLPIQSVFHYPTPTALASMPELLASSTQKSVEPKLIFKSGI